MKDLEHGLGKQGSDYGASDPRPKRTVEFSQVENVYVLRYENINPAGRLFGGQLVSWIDEVAGACAIRHTGHIVIQRPSTIWSLSAAPILPTGWSSLPA